MGPGDMAGMARGGLPQGSRLDGEVGYGLPVGSRFVGTPRVGFFSSQYGRNYRVGYGLRVLDRDSVNVELGVDAQRRESPMLGGTDHGVLSQTSVGRQRANGRHVTARVGAWHTTESRVYRDDTACTEGNNIEPKNRRQGTGAKDKWPMSVVSFPAIVSRSQL